MNIIDVLAVSSLILSLSALILLVLLWMRTRRYIELVRIALKLGEKPGLSRTGRIRKRYVVFAVVSDHELSNRVLEKAIRERFRILFGESNLVKADPQLVYYDPSIKRGVIRVSHTYKDQLIALLGSIREINGARILIIPLKSTGTIKRARRILYRLRRELQV